MKKLRHNKKRNTLFLFEELIQEMTKCITVKDEQRKQEALLIIREFFCEGSELKKEKDLLSNVVYSENMTPRSVENLIFHTKEEYVKLNSEFIFEQQSKLIKRINKDLGGDVFKTFVQNYKKIATIHQLFNADLSPKQRVLIEQTLSSKLIEEQNEEEVVHIDKLVFAKFVQKFNEKYSSLDDKQRKLLKNHRI